MKKSNKLLCIILSLIMLLSAMPLTAFAERTVVETGECGENVTYTLYSDGELVISGTGDMYDYSFGDSPFYDNENITSVVIEDGVTSIGMYSLYQCHNIKYITIGNSITSLNFYDLFSYEQVFEELTIGTGLMNISELSLFSCKFFNVDSDNKYFSNDGYGALFNKDKTKLIMLPTSNTLNEYVIPDSVITADEYAFSGASNLKKLTFGENFSLDTIYNTLYRYLSDNNLEFIAVDPDNKNLSNDEYGVLFNKDKSNLICYPTANTRTEYTIPETVKKIENLISDYIEKIEIGNNVTTLNSNAFSSCQSLKTVSIGSGVELIGDCVFSSCNKIEYINVDVNNEFYSNDEYGALFNKDKSKLISYPVGNSRDEYTIPNTVEIICERAFSSCDSLISIIIPDSVKLIGSEAFARCSELKNVTIGNGLVAVAEYAFQRSPKIENIVLPESCLYLGSAAFDAWAEEMYIPLAAATATVPKHVVFENSSVFSPNYTIYGYSNSDAEKYAEINGNTFVSLDGEACAHNDENADSICDLCGFDFTAVKSGYLGKNVTYNLYEDGKLIISGTGDMNNFIYYESAFSFYPFAYKDVRTVVINEGVTSIGDYVFAGCTSLESISIPDTVSLIGNDAFMSCSSLKSITLEGDNKHFIIDEYGVLYDINKTVLIKSPANNAIGDYTVPQSVKEIEAYAFYKSENLKSLTILGDISSIGNCAFSECTQLETLQIKGDVSSIGTAAFSDCENLKTVTFSGDVGIIGVYSFLLCVNLESLTFSGSIDKVETVAFALCEKLLSVRLPKNINEIGTYAFGWTESYEYGALVIEDFTIYGYTGTAAETYANENGITFIALDGETCIHEWEEIVLGSTCKVQGASYEVCILCTETKNYTVLPLADHTYGEWTTVTEATFANDGLKERVCSVCGDTQSEIIPRLEGDSIVTDDNTDISITFPENTFDNSVEITVTEEYDGESYNILNLEKGNFQSKLFDINVLSDGEKVQPNGPVLVKIPVPDGFNPENITVYYVPNDGSGLVKMNSWLEDGYICFETDHFSAYALVDESTDSEQTNCDHLCHKDGFVGFFWKIIRFFWKIFKMNPVCECGMAHY